MPGDQRRRGAGDHGVVAVAGVVRADLPIGGTQSLPTMRLRRMIGVQRSAKISAPSAIGQYWP